MSDQSPENEVAEWSIVAEDGTSMFTSEDVARAVAAGEHVYTMGVDRSPVAYAFTRPGPDDKWTRVNPPEVTDR